MRSLGLVITETWEKARLRDGQQVLKEGRRLPLFPFVVSN